MSGIHEKMSCDSRTGIVHIPTAHRSNPGHPKGSFRYHDNKLDDGTGKHMHMSPNHENIWIEFRLGCAFLPNARTYKLQMRYQTDQAQDKPLKLVVKRGDPNSDAVHSLDISLPNTQNKWQTLDPPISLEVNIGGPPDTYFVFTHPKPQGKGILIRDFQLIPLGAEGSGEYSAAWLAKWMDDLQATVKDCIMPQLDSAGATQFRECCKKANAARQKVQQTKEEEAKKEAEKELQRANNDCLQAALPLLKTSIEPTLDSIDFQEQGDGAARELLQCIVLTHGTPSKLAEYASRSEKQRKRLLNFLHNVDLMYQMLVHGGPRGGNYGKALDIYTELEARRQQGKSVFPKLSLAVALEFAEPIQTFGQKSVLIDPIERYLHYEEAYLDRELEPAFESFSVWELRMAVNSDAPNDQLAWCRAMIRNYNPNIAIMDDYHWRFAWIVRTDVTYNAPVWTRSPRDYKQIVSGGGMCGPRAWMGRFACKAFGNPTWGVRQPGHAAMTRWTPNGWMTALGGGFRVSWWEERDGLDFECETKIRASVGDEIYFQKAGLLDWIALIVGERQKECHVTNKLWPSLAIVQRQRLSKVEAKRKQLGQCEVLPIITELKQRPDKAETITTANDGSIVVPVACRTSAEGGPAFWKSFLGGKQAFLRPKWSLTFKLPLEEIPERKVFKLSVRFVNVHEKEEYPLLVSVTDGNDGTVREYNIPLPYTVGEWKDSEPIDIEMGGAADIIKLTRKEPRFPLALKDFKLTPC